MTECTALLDLLRAPATAKVLAALPGSRIVGGAVRDTLAGLPVVDVDVGAPFPPEQIMARLRSAGCKVSETGLSHGTVTAVWNHHPIEVKALRRDVLTDGRHAEVAWTTDWPEDAARRDFTINAMSLGADGVLHDYFGGRDDLARGLVRFVGDPATRLAEDYLRLLRFFRFQARYGKGAPDEAALHAIRAAVPGIARLSVERIWMELKRILMVVEPAPTLALMAELGVLPAILPEIPAPDLACLARLVALGAPPEPLLRLAALGGPAPVLAARLKLSTAENRALRFLQEAAIPGAEIAAAGFRRWRAQHGAVALEIQGAALWLADARKGAAPLRASLRATLHAEAAPILPIQGRDLLAAGATPGPALGSLLAKLEDFWIAGGCVADQETCLAEGRRLMEDAIYATQKLLSENAALLDERYSLPENWDDEYEAYVHVPNLIDDPYSIPSFLHNLKVTAEAAMPDSMSISGIQDAEEFDLDQQALELTSALIYLHRTSLDRDLSSSILNRKQ